ncbi:MAG: PEP-CTERM sorting domain-containing protein [Anaerohalosphaera sp.]|nr:PEP-CTERM sorting domain-containing protein [Anaerohalosphaera sp.]
MMKKLMFVLSCVMLLAVGANAALITNGDFETGDNWNSKASTTQPVGWYSPMCEAAINGHYGESITNLSDRPALMKSAGTADNYYQQVLSGVDAGTIGSYTVGFDYGVRHHSSYATQPGDSYTLRVSLWDTSANTELAWTSVEILYPDGGGSDNNFLTSISEALTYDNSGLAGNELALRFTNTTPNLGGDIGHKTIMFDNVTIVPEPATMALLALGGLMLRRKR